MSLYRDGKIKPIGPLRVFDSSDVVQAFRHFASKERVGKTAVSFENMEVSVKVSYKFKTSKCRSEYADSWIGSSIEAQYDIRRRENLPHDRMPWRAWPQHVQMDDEARCQEVRLPRSIRARQDTGTKTCRGARERRRYYQSRQGRRRRL